MLYSVLYGKCYWIKKASHRYLSVYGLPSLWKEYFGDDAAGSVRGGVRGSQITDEFLAYERRQAANLGMSLNQQN